MELSTAKRVTIWESARGKEKERGRGSRIVSSSDFVSIAISRITRMEVHIVAAAAVVKVEI